MMIITDRTRRALVAHYRQRIVNAPAEDRLHLLKRILFHEAVNRRPEAETLLSMLVNSRTPAAIDLLVRL